MNEQETTQLLLDIRRDIESELGEVKSQVTELSREARIAILFEEAHIPSPEKIANAKMALDKSRYELQLLETLLGLWDSFRARLERDSEYKREVIRRLENV